MKKIYVNIILVILICIFSVLSLMACSNENGRSSDNGKTTNEQGDKEKPSQDKNDKNTSNNKDNSSETSHQSEKMNLYRPLDETDYPDDIRDALGYIGDLRGFGIIKEDDEGIYLFIGLGEKSTGGYDIELKKVTKDDGGNMVFTIEEITPKKDDMVIQVITYPNMVIKIEEKLEPDNISVVTTDGEVLKDINEESEE